MKIIRLRKFSDTHLERNEEGAMFYSVPKPINNVAFIGSQKLIFTYNLN